MAVISTAQRIKNGKTKPTRFYSDKQEKSVVKNIGGKQTKNSGATMFSKGDVLSEKFLIECKTKTTSSDSISIKKEWFEKNKKESLFMGKPYSTLVFSFGPNEENHYVIDEELFQILCNCLEGLNDEEN